MRGFRVVNSVPSVLRKTVGFTSRHIEKMVSNPIAHRRLDVFSDVLLSKEEISISLMHAIHSKDVLQGLNLFEEQPKDIVSVYDEKNERMTLLSRLLYADYVQYMQDDILVKVDRAAMSTSLEGRNPLLDHRIIEFASQLPDEFKYHKSVKKRLLKDIVYKHVPKTLVEKPKTGFSVPLSRWLRLELKDYISQYLSTSFINAYGVFNIDAISTIMDCFKKYPDVYASELWKVLQFQMWYERWMLGEQNS